MYGPDPYHPAMELRPNAAAAPPGAMPPAIEEPLCAVFRQHLKGLNQKYTPERAHILDTVLRFDGLFEAEQLEQTVREGGFRVSRSTVYRTLDLLEDAGIIQRVPFERDRSHYQLAYGKSAGTLLINVETGDVETLDLTEVIAAAERLCRERGLELEGHRLHIFAKPSSKPNPQP